ncbi:phosphotransferase enzyme family protein [Paenibacillus eucommiae]|uniref:Ser/Thr protein kinase RdoA (MazF antagonist) n=1 Tax=Paenibacillus eucommiae TaxID=1355755 RepID=A0ABS4JA23_9BACL|nr:phosphotransferase [Paenibacillus eucommiae]MBP1996687.1 Ser/Thr protein kinase RdoA (MazF antagonist) [Paenibacillus eucommiae]
MLSEKEYENIAKKALEKYPIFAEKLVYLGLSDNVTFRVETKDEDLKYLIKLHYSTNGSRSKDFIESELIWLEALASDSKHDVPAPVKNGEGELVTTVTVEDLEDIDNLADGFNEEMFVTLHHWVHGELLNRQPTGDETRRLALLMADLHAHSKKWDAPDRFTRPAYNSLHLMTSYKQLRQNLKGLIADEYFSSLKETVDQISIEIDSQNMSRDSWGLIHSDLHEANYVFYKDNPRPIDFSNCGHGYYLFDLAETCMHLSFENQKVFVSTYGTVHPLQDDYRTVIEAFFIWSIIRTFAFHSQNPKEIESLKRDLPFVIDHYCKKYLEHTTFLLD